MHWQRTGKRCWQWRAEQAGTMGPPLSEAESESCVLLLASFRLVAAGGRQFWTSRRANARHPWVDEPAARPSRGGRFSFSELFPPAICLKFSPERASWSKSSPSPQTTLATTWTLPIHTAGRPVELDLSGLDSDSESRPRPYAAQRLLYPYTASVCSVAVAVACQGITDFVASGPFVSPHFASLEMPIG